MEKVREFVKFQEDMKSAFTGTTETLCDEDPME